MRPRPFSLNELVAVVVLSPWNYPFFRIFSVLYAFFPFRILHVLFTNYPFWDLSLLSYSRELFLSLMSCVPHGLLSFTIVLVASLLGFLPKIKEKEKKKVQTFFLFLETTSFDLLALWFDFPALPSFLSSHTPWGFE